MASISRRPLIANVKALAIVRMGFVFVDEGVDGIQTKYVKPFGTRTAWWHYVISVKVEKHKSLEFCDLRSRTTTGVAGSRRFLTRKTTDNRVQACHCVELLLKGEARRLANVVLLEEGVLAQNEPFAVRHKFTISYRIQAGGKDCLSQVGGTYFHRI